MSILFELGDGSATCLCVEKKTIVGRNKWLGYWRSKTFQVHRINVWKFVISWRIGPYKHKKGDAVKIDDTEENRQKIDAVADRLLGSCSSLDDALQEVFADEDLSIIDVATPLLHRLDDITMQCESCGWWCEAGEIDENSVCDDCRADS